jgi:hypothetical protein
VTEIAVVAFGLRYGMSFAFGVACGRFGIASDEYDDRCTDQE